MEEDYYGNNGQVPDVQYPPYENSYNDHFQPPHDQLPPEETPSHKINRVSTSPSPFLNLFCQQFLLNVVLDTGATVNLIHERLAKYLNLPIYPSTQTAHQADGKSLLIVGETRAYFYRGDIKLFFEGLVVRDLDSEVLGGIPFLEANDIGVFPKRKQINIGELSIKYKSSHQENSNSIHRILSPLSIICDEPATIFPSEFIDIKYSDTTCDTSVVIQPQPKSNWLQPSLSHCVDGKVRLTNTSSLPVKVLKDEVIASVSTLQEEDHISDILYDPPVPIASEKPSPELKSIKFNPQNEMIDPEWKQKFVQLHSKYSDVFSSSLPGYNGKFGAICASVNIGDSLPPQRRGRIPQYSKSLLSELQHQFDELQRIGVFATPENAGL